MAISNISAILEGRLNNVSYYYLAYYTLVLLHRVICNFLAQPTCHVNINTIITYKDFFKLPGCLLDSSSITSFPKGVKPPLFLGTLVIPV